MDTVFIQELKLAATIGVWEWEQKIKQRLIVDLEVGTDIRMPAERDDLNDAVSYKDIAASVTNFVENSDFKLIETLAEKIAELVLGKFSVDWCKVTVNKPRAVENSRNVGVTIVRHRSEQDLKNLKDSS